MGSKVYQHFPFIEGMKPISENPLDCLLQRNWYPTATVTGQSGIPDIECAGNILHPSVELRFSVRLPPNFPVE